MRRMVPVLALLLCLLVGALPVLGTHQVAHAAAGCQFLSAPGAVPAFCDTFDAPAGTGNRSGDLDGNVWGVSRINQLNNTGGWNDAWFDTTLDLCGTPTAVRPERDIQICNGHMAESVNDGDGAALLAMYPTQPFDIAGRTGTVSFDVSADSEGSHMAWPAFVYTDQPVPAPDENAPDIETLPRNGFGFTIASGTPCGAGTSGLQEAWVSRNYAASALPLTRLDNCFSFAPPLLNHFEVRIAQDRVEIWASDAGGANFHELGFIPNANLPLTRGLIWIEDGHYAANKFGTQQTHTFAWDNVGFDGPVLPGDLHLDAPDSMTANSIAGVNLGYPFSADTPVSFAIPGADAASVALSQQAGHGALLTFNAQPNGTPSITYTLNGNAPHTIPWPLGGTLTGNGWDTFALPIPATELVVGTNTVGVSFGTGGVIANVDLILVGVRDTGGGPTATPAAPTSTGTATNTPAPPTATNTATSVPPTSTPVPATATNTPAPPTATRTATATKTATATATATPGQCSLESIVRNKSGVIVLHTTTPYAC